MDVDRYVKGIFDRFHYFATWMPNAPRALGDVGILDGKSFEPVTSLDKLAIAFEARSGAPADLSHTSESGVSIAFKAPGALAAPSAALLQAKAGAVVEFGERGAFVFQAAQCVERTIIDKVRLGQDILVKAQEGSWDLDWVVIDTIVKANSATILVSNSRTSKIELSAEAEVPGGAVGLASAEARLSVAAQSGDITHFIAAKGIMPLFRLSRLNRSLFDRLRGRKPVFGPVRSGDREPSGEGDEWLETVVLR